jgi:hypothetical protein
VAVSDKDRIVADLLNHPGWAIVLERVSEKRVENAHRLAKAMLLKPVPEFDQGEARGWYQALGWVLAGVNKAGKSAETTTEELSN